MIVADTNLIAYLLIDGPFTSEARAVYEKDQDWVAPSFWRSEFRNVLVLSLRRGITGFTGALEVMEDADLLMAGKDRDSPSAHILRLAADSGCAAYDYIGSSADYEIHVHGHFNAGILFLTRLSRA